MKKGVTSDRFFLPRSSPRASWVGCPARGCELRTTTRQAQGNTLFSTGNGPTTPKGAEQAQQQSTCRKEVDQRSSQEVNLVRQSWDQQSTMLNTGKDLDWRPEIKRSSWAPTEACPSSVAHGSAPAAWCQVRAAPYQSWPWLEAAKALRVGKSLWLWQNIKTAMKRTWGLM